MTEYTSSPEAVREHMSAKERTAWWIRHHPPTEQYSPSAPPSDRGEIEEDAQSYTVIDSDAESTHSIPPKMLLKYGDGRPDIPISHWHHEHSGEPLSRSVSTRDNGYPSPGQSNNHRRSRSEQPVARTTSRQLHPQDSASMRFPEEIRVLPSESREAPRPAAPQYQRRSKSQPRHGYSPPEEPRPPLPLYPAPQHTPQPIHTSRSIYQNPVHHRAPQVAYSQSHPMYQKKDPYASRHSDRDRSPPSIVYAPRTNSRNHYAPPILIHHQHRAPVPRYPLTGGPPFSLARGGLASVNEDPNSRGPSAARAARGHGVRLGESRSQTPSSQGTGSTYYVLPTPGQKVQIISPDGSMDTASSTTQSPSPTHSGSSKKTFFSRFFNIAEKFTSSDSQSRSSSVSGKRLQRRHSSSASSKGRPSVPVPR